MRNLPLVATALLTLTSGCVVYDARGGHPINEAGVTPEITYADAGCFFDEGYADFVWYFDSDVADGHDGTEVATVWADVFDRRTGDWVDGFDLYRDDSPLTWYSAWVGESTWLDCTFDGYIVDITAETYDQNLDIAEVIPTTM